MLSMYVQLLLDPCLYFSLCCFLWFRAMFQRSGAVPGENKADDQLYEVFSKLGKPALRPPPPHFQSGLLEDSYESYVKLSQEMYNVV